MDARMRDMLVEHHWPLVLSEASRLHARLPRMVDVDDMVSDGAIGLLDAISRFDPQRAQFATFARPKIRGAMFDGLRARDPISRSTRTATKQLQRATETLRAKLGKQPTPQEIAEQLGIPLALYTKKESHARHSVTHSLSGARIFDDSRQNELSIERLADERQIDPARQVTAKLIREALLNGFSRAERLIVILYYYEGLTMKEIGLALDLCESRICQMHKLILAKLRARLSAEKTMALLARSQRGRTLSSRSTG